MKRNSQESAINEEDFKNVVGRAREGSSSVQGEEDPHSSNDLCQIKDLVGISMDLGTSKYQQDMTIIDGSPLSGPNVSAQMTGLSPGLDILTKKQTMTNKSGLTEVIESSIEPSQTLAPITSTSSPVERRPTPPLQPTPPRSQTELSPQMRSGGEVDKISLGHESQVKSFAAESLLNTILEKAQSIGIFESSKTEQQAQEHRIGLLMLPH